MLNFDLIILKEVAIMPLVPLFIFLILLAKKGRSGDGDDSKKVEPERNSASASALFGRLSTPSFGEISGCARVFFCKRFVWENVAKGVASGPYVPLEKSADALGSCLRPAKKDKEVQGDAVVYALATCDVGAGGGKGVQGGSSHLLAGSTLAPESFSDARQEPLDATEVSISYPPRIRGNPQYSTRPFLPDWSLV